MFVLDTHVVSELLRPTPSQAVVTWIDSQPLQCLFLSAITAAELRFAVAVMASSRRRDFLVAEVEMIISDDFHDRVLSFDSAAARVYADIAASCRKLGEIVSVKDCQIAAIAYSSGMAVVTRNVGNFLITDVDVVSPWVQT